MFYSQLVLTKKGPLGKVWVAATLGESRVSKSYASTAKIHVLCQSIEQPAAPFALRLSSTLMLGVVRVFSRKSTIILADVTSIMQSIKRWKVQQANRAVGKKRARDALSVASGENHGISLEKGQDTARFELITLPMQKKRKSGPSGGAAAPSDVLSKSAGSLSRAKFSHGSGPGADFSFGDTGEIDVLAAMETVFPSVLVPRTTVGLASGLSTPSTANKSQTPRNMLYSVREQDITLTDPFRQNGSAQYGMLEEGLSLSLGSDALSSDGVSRTLWFSEAGNGPTQINAPQSGEPLLKPEGEFEPLGIEPLQLEPLDFETPKAEVLSPQGIQEPIEEVSVARSAKKAAGEAVRSISKKPKSSVTFSDDASDACNPPSKTPGTRESKRKEPRGMPPLSTGRKRRSPADRLDQITELAPSEIRRCLHDTADIVIEHFGDRTVPKKVQTAKDLNAFAIPGFLSPFAKAITDVWKEVTAPPFTTGERPQRVIVPKTTRAADIATPNQSGKEQEVRANLVQVLFPEEEEEPLQIPVLQDPPGNRRDSSVEYERSQGKKTTNSKDQYSAPSSSIEGKNLSSDQGVSSGSRNALGISLDKVTPADLKAFEEAQNSPGERQWERLLPQVENAGDAEGSSGKIGVSSSDGVVESSAIPVNTAEFELIEETERLQNTLGTGSLATGPVSSLNVRAFKMLQVLRSIVIEREQGAESTASVSPVTTFGDLAAGCTRGGAARAFFNMLSLVNARFVTVKQETAYGQISVFRGIHF